MLSALYVASGVTRAVVFEPVFRWMARRQTEDGRIARLRDAARLLLERNPLLQRAMQGPWAPMIVSYNLDPMAGRVAAAAIGMGAVRGWLLALIADYVYFVTTAVPTVWVQHFVGNVWVTLAIVMVLAIVVPWVWRRARPLLPPG